jgi:Protein of unknown function (DUF2550)
MRAPCHRPAAGHVVPRGGRTGYVGTSPCRKPGPAASSNVRYGALVIIALAAVLGVDLVVIVILMAVLLIRRRWISHQPGAFKGVVRVVDGEIAGFKAKWKRGYGRWVSDVFIWTRSPFLFRYEVIAGKPLEGEVRMAEPGEVKRMRKHPVVIPVEVDGGGRLEVATSQDDQERATVSQPSPAP